MRLLRKRTSKTIEIAGKKVKIVPFNARQGLDATLMMASLMEQASSYIPLLGDRSRSIRALSLLKMINDVQGFDKFIINVVAISTGIFPDVIETDATFKELLQAFEVIWELNEWNKFWEVAYSIRLVDRRNWFAWVASEAKRIRHG